MTDLVSDNLSQLYSLLWFEHLMAQSMVHIYTPLGYLSLLMDFSYHNLEKLIKKCENISTK